VSEIGGLRDGTKYAKNKMGRRNSPDENHLLDKIFFYIKVQ